MFRARHSHHSCVLCEAILSPYALLHDGFYVGNHEVQARAKVGCPACAFLLAGISAIYGKNFLGSQDISPTLYNFRVTRLKSGAIRLQVLSADISFFARVRAIPWLGSKPSRGIFSRRSHRWESFIAVPTCAKKKKLQGDVENVMKSFITPDPWRTDLSHRIQTARDWLEQCTSKHNCFSVAMASPKRLLRIELYTDTLVVSLHENLQNASLPYACLSYCWGGPQKLTLTEATSEELRLGIQTSRLSKTISDAVYVAHSLGLEYLWVDALCIRQDSLADWSHECNQMAAIYGASVVTIQAESPARADDGFLDSYKPRQAQSFRVRSRINTDIYVRSTVEHSDWSSLSMLAGVSSQNVPPLYTRAWVLQEQMLSPRTISFGCHEMTWECRAQTRCECCSQQHVLSEEGISEQLVSKHELEKLSQMDPRGVLRETKCSDCKSQTEVKCLSPTEFRATNILEFRSFWNGLVYNYSMRKLSSANDRLIALDGIVQKLEPIWGSCHKGHWTFDFLRSLYWRSCESDGQQPPKKRAPSWSWASLEYPHGVSLFDASYDQEDWVEAVATPHLGYDTLIFRAPVFELKRHPTKLSPWSVDLRSWMFHESSDDEDSDYPLDQFESHKLRGKAYLDRGSKNGRFIVCLRWSTASGRFDGLLCSRTIKETKSYYERVGVCSGWRKMMLNKTETVHVI